VTAADLGPRRRGAAWIARRFTQLPVAVQAAICWVPGCLVFFRDQFTSGFDRIGGDGADARLVVVLHEHWFNVFRGRASWTSPNFFFPAKGALGYSDTLFLNQIFYGPLRAIGLDPFLAFEWAVILLSLLGFAGFFLLCRTELSLGVGASAALATAFAFANNLNIISVHPQLYALYWLPALLLLLLRVARAQSRLRRAAWGAVSGLLFGLMLFSAYYIAWFVVLAAIVLALVYGSLSIRIVGWRRVVGLARSAIAGVVGFAGGTIAGLVPFLIVYVPVLRATGGRTYEQVMSYAATPRDVLNLGRSNYLWGPVVRSHVPVGHLLNTETSLAVTPLLFVLAAGAVALAIRHRGSPGLATLTRLCAATGITAAILAVLPIRFGFGSLWRIPWVLMPGAEGIRAIGRVDLVVAPMVCLTVALGLVLVERTWSRTAPRAPLLSAGLTLLLAIAVVEQFNTGEFAGIDRSIENSRLDEAPSPPQSCRSFFVIDRQMLSFVANIDAMLLAVHLGIPTVNGYSGQYPPGFILLDMSDPAYFDNVRSWVAANHVEDGLCSYDTVSHTWMPAPPP